MSRSVADWNLERLSARARDTLERIAGPHADGTPLDELAARHGLSKREVSLRMAELRSELDAQQHGATLRPLTGSEYEALKESIRAHGQQMPALVDPATGELLDGHHRRRACEELGLELKTEPYHGELHHDVALALNLVRRSVTPADRRRAVAAELMRDPQRSDRAVAAAVGVTHPTVALVRRELEQHGQVESLTTRIGADGKRQAASKPPRQEAEPQGRLDYIALELRSLSELEDRQHAHAQADRLVSEALRLAGLDQVADAFEAGRWWQ